MVVLMFIWTCATQTLTGSLFNIAYKILPSLSHGQRELNVNERLILEQIPKDIETRQKTAMWKCSSSSGGPNNKIDAGQWALSRDPSIIVFSAHPVGINNS